MFYCQFVVILDQVFSFLAKKVLLISPGEGGGTLIFSYIRRLGSFFLVQNFVFQYFFGFLEKLIFWGV